MFGRWTLSYTGPDRTDGSETGSEGEDDGVAVNIPKIAISTGQIDAMECVLEKMGIDHGEFGNPGDDGSASERIHIYRGGSSGSPSGARIDGSTPHDTALYGDLDRIHAYDLVVADCEGGAWDSSYAQRDASGDHVREYVNRGGRFFASHLSHSWLHQNGSEPYSMVEPIETGLGAAATWVASAISSPNSGPGRIAIGRPRASAHIDAFAEWMVYENVVATADSTFTITDPRSQASALGDSSEDARAIAPNSSRSPPRTRRRPKKPAAASRTAASTSSAAAAPIRSRAPCSPRTARAVSPTRRRCCSTCCSISAPAWASRRSRRARPRTAAVNAGSTPTAVAI